MTGFVSMWLTQYPTDRWSRRYPEKSSGPVVLSAPGQGGVRVMAVNHAAADEGLVPGITLAEARALVPGVTVGESDPTGDAEGLHRLAIWCQRWTPRVAVDGDDGLVLDVAGCAHLFGGEGALLADVAKRLTRAGVGHYLGMAPTPAAAWAWARYRPARSVPIVGAEAHRSSMASLPIAALRVASALSGRLTAVGLRTVGDLLDMARAPLAVRFGEALIHRLDVLLGTVPEPLVPVTAPADWSVRMALPEPISRAEDFELATARLLADLTASLRAAGQGARALTLSLYRVDGSLQELSIGTSRPTRDPNHLLRLYRERLAAVEPGYGVEVLTLAATEVNALAAEQIEAVAGPRDGSAAGLVDRLQVRAGRRALLRYSAVSSHVPERSWRLLPADGEAAPEGTEWAADGERPVLLLTPPEPLVVDDVAALPDGFYWRGRRYVVALIEGPERIRSEWWRDPDAVRDYYRVQEVGGRRFWICRRRGAGAEGWYMHGLFA